MAMPQSSLVDYYRELRFNPVPISLADKALWKLHVAKRRNLYERHLGIPISLLRGRRIIEFGCNSGENALVLASIGADLTLVEPNKQVFPRLESYFKKFGFEKRISSLVNSDIAGFKSGNVYDMVIAEGFINTLPDREEAIRKLCALTVKNGLIVVSHDDRYGHFMEMVRKFVFWIACRLEHVEDMYGARSLEIARRLHGSDFASINASRQFESWWKDVLVNPFVSYDKFWTCSDVVSLFDGEGCEYYSGSPRWDSVDRFSWYKNIITTKEIHCRLLSDWMKVFSFFVTGIPPSEEAAYPAPKRTVDAASVMVKMMSEFCTPGGNSNRIAPYPTEIDKYFRNSSDERIIRFNHDMKSVWNAAAAGHLDIAVTKYRKAKYLRKMWGVASPYLCFRKAR